MRSLCNSSPHHPPTTPGHHAVVTKIIHERRFYHVVPSPPTLTISGVMPKTLSMCPDFHYVVLLGGPGSGKGHLAAEKFVKEHNFTHISPGEFNRAGWEIFPKYMQNIEDLRGKKRNFDQYNKEIVAFSAACTELAFAIPSSRFVLDTSVTAPITEGRYPHHAGKRVYSALRS